METVMIKRTQTCPFCGKPHSIMIPFSEYWAWECGAPMEQAMKSLTYCEQKQISTKVCPDCQKEILGYQ